MIYFRFSGVEFVAWVNIYPPLIASTMEMKIASERMWSILKRHARTSLFVELMKVIPWIAGMLMSLGAMVKGLPLVWREYKM